MFGELRLSNCEGQVHAIGEIHQWLRRLPSGWRCPPERSVVLKGRGSEHDIAGFLHRNADVLRERRYNVGGWYVGTGEARSAQNANAVPGRGLIPSTQSALAHASSNASLRIC